MLYNSVQHIPAVVLAAINSDPPIGDANRGQLGNTSDVGAVMMSRDSRRQVEDTQPVHCDRTFGMGRYCCFDAHCSTQSLFSINYCDDDALYWH